MKQDGRSEEDSPAAALGFLTVREDPQHGFLGGYLVLNAAGRPLEFHCTAPVRPNRAQEILYGPTLQPYLFGEQIGLALVRKSRRAASVILTDVAPAAALGEWIDTPVGLVLAEDSADSNAAVQAPAGWSECAVLGQRLAEPPRAASPARLLDALRDSGAAFPLLEPFQRIAAALQEARSAA